MAHYTFSIHIDAPREQVLALWTNLQRMGEWVGGVTGVTDVSGPVDRAGTTYVVQFGPVKSPTEVLEAEPPPSLRDPVRQLDSARQVQRDVRARR